MCGRYVFVPDKNFFAEFEISNRDFVLQPNYNIAPGQMMPVVTMNSPKKITEMKWGLIPFWAKEPKVGFATINARSEEVNLRPAFRTCLKNKRCLIPASGFYEWNQKGVKKPYLFRLKNGENFAFAGLFDIFREKIFSYTILTTRANELVGKIHDRMPVILHKKDWEVWADNTRYEELVLKDLLKPLSGLEMEMIPVSLAVNNPRNNYPELAFPIKDT